MKKVLLGFAAGTMFGSLLTFFAWLNVFVRIPGQRDLVVDVVTDKIEEFVFPESFDRRRRHQRKRRV